MRAIAGAAGPDPAAGAARREDPLGRWLRGQAAVERGLRFLEDALLTGRFAPYAVHRLRFFFARHAVAVALHAVKFTLLTTIFAPGAFLGLVGVHAVAGLATAFWWGALESMRGRIRRLVRRGRRDRIPAEIQAWLTVAAILAATAGGAALVWTVTRSIATGELDLFDAYVLAVALTAALDLAVLAYHSGVYAMRRVYRPLSSMVVVEAGGFATVLALWPWLGAWSFPLAVAVSGGLSGALIAIYASRLYRFYDIPAVAFAPREGFRRLTGSRGLEALRAGSSYAILKIDSLVILSLFVAGGGRGDGAVLASFFFAVAPTVQASFEWAQLFYFDWKRLEAQAFDDLRRRFEHAVARLAIVVGLALWGVAVLVGGLLLGRFLGIVDTALLLPFFVSRSALAFRQVRAFAGDRHASLLATGAGILAGIGLLRAVEGGETVAIVVVTLLAVVAGYALRGASEPPPRHESDEARSRLAWLREVAGRAAPTRIGAVVVTFPARLDRRGAERATWRLAERLARRLEGRGGTTLLAVNRVVWWEDGDGDSRVAVDWWMRSAAGAVEDYRALRGPSGPAALRTAAREGALGGELATVVGRSADVPSVGELERSFRERVPGGLVVDPRGALAPALEEATPKTRRRVLAAAATFSRDLETLRAKIPWEVTCFAPKDELVRLFLAPRAVGRERRAIWRRTIRRANLRAALAASPAWVASSDSSSRSSS